MTHDADRAGATACGPTRTPSGPVVSGEHLAPLAELATRLAALSWEPDAEALADAVWLARHVSARPPAPRAAPGAADEPAVAEHPAPPPDARVAAPEPPAPEFADDVPLFIPPSAEGHPSDPYTAPRSEEPAPPSPGAENGPSLQRVRAPAVSALSGLLQLQRALRPLARYRPPVPEVRRRTHRLDERASAEASARSGALTPVFAPSRARTTEMQLVMDASPTSSVWRLAFEQLRQSCEQSGAFRDVRAFYLHRTQAGTPAVSTSPRIEDRGLRPPGQFGDVTGRRFTLLLSDCAGRLWEEGAAQRMLHAWCRGPAPVALVQPLPPRLWPRTALPAESGELRRMEGGGRVLFRADRGPAARPGAHAVPVLLPVPGALANWARMMGSRAPQTTRGAAARVHQAYPPVRPRTGAVDDPHRLLDDFLAGASPGAVELAVHLTAVPLLPPVIELVQRAMLPDTGPMELAEVLLGGVLERLPERGGGPRYRFAPGVAELLADSLDRDASLLVLKHVSEYVTQHFGRGVRNFPALAALRLAGGDEPSEGQDEWGAAAWRPPGGEELFAQVPEAVVVRFLGTEAAGFAVSGPAEEQMLDEVEEVLRERPDPGYAEGARRLRHAEALASSVLDAPEAAPGVHRRARLLLARTLRARAHAHADAHPVPEAPTLLSRALDLLRDDDAASGRERAAVHHALWRATSGRAHLFAARDELLRLGESSQGADALALARVLLDLARTADDAPERRRWGGQAVRLFAEYAEQSEARGRLSATALLDRAAALRAAEAPEAELLHTLAEAREAAGENHDLRFHVALAEARTHRAASRWPEAERCYAEAEQHCERYSERRCELLAEWGELRLSEMAEPHRAEGLLHEALTGARQGAGITLHLQRLLADALLRRYRTAAFLPDLYEATHLLHSAAHQAEEPLRRAEYWRLLAEAYGAFPEAEPPRQQAEEALARATAAAYEALDDATGTPAHLRTARIELFRTLLSHGRATETAGRPSAALDLYRTAAEQARLLAAEPGPTGSAPRLAAAETEFVRQRIRLLEGDIDPWENDSTR